MKKSNPKQRFRPHHTLELLAIAGALGGIALVSQPVPASRPANTGRPQTAALPILLGPNARASVMLGPTDRCVIEAPQVDDRFVRTAPQVDDRFVVNPMVQGLPVSGRTTKIRSRR